MYLRKFENFTFTNLGDLIEGLSNLFKDNLAYIIDDDNIEFGFDFEENDECITGFIQSNSDKAVNWKEIENDIIPFLTLLDEKYLLHNNFIFFDGDDNPHNFKIIDIIEDRVQIEKVNSIMFYIIDKK